MANNPLDNNPNYKKLFTVRNTDNNDNLEVVILYEKIRQLKPHEPKYVLARYKQYESVFPFKIFHKFSDIILSEMTDTPIDIKVGNNLMRTGNVKLFITTIYNNEINTTMTQRFEACCGSLLFAQQLETELFKVFF